MVATQTCINTIKIHNSLLICNSSLVQEKERYDAELYYLKFISAQISNMKLEQETTNDNDDNCNSSSNNENSDSSNEMKVETSQNDKADGKKTNNNNEMIIANKIETLFPRYKELVAKHGISQEKKVESETFETVNVRLMSMDPKSITVESLFKKLPVNMTVAQLKMLFKRHFKLKPKYQRLMMREKGSQEMPIDLGNDTSTLAFCGLKDGMEILMQSNDFEKEN